MPTEQGSATLNAADAAWLANVLRYGLWRYHDEGRREESGHLSDAMAWDTCPHPQCAKYRRLITILSIEL